MYWPDNFAHKEQKNSTHNIEAQKYKHLHMYELYYRQTKEIHSLSRMFLKPYLRIYLMLYRNAEHICLWLDQQIDLPHNLKELRMFGSQDLHRHLILGSSSGMYPHKQMFHRSIVIHIICRMDLKRDLRNNLL